LPMVGSSALSCLITGAVNAKKNLFWQTFVLASCLMLTALCLLTTLKNNLGVQPVVYGAEALMGFGFGCTVATASMMAAAEIRLRDQSVAQGIVAQLRIFGGSIGIAASTAILGTTERDQLGGIISSSQLDNLEAAAKTFTPVQGHAVRQAYSDAFRKDMIVATLIAGLNSLVVLGTYRRNPPSMQDSRKQQLIEERERVRRLDETKPAKVKSRATV